MHWAISNDCKSSHQKFIKSTLCLFLCAFAMQSKTKFLHTTQYIVTEGKNSYLSAVFAI